ncbi:response regulator, partial [Flavobacterium fluviatile]
MNEIKLIIADDHELFRKGLAELLRKHDDLKIVKSVGDGVEFMELINTKFEADIVLLDITMPNMDGFQVLKELKTLNSDIRPIVISMHNDGNYIAKCAKMGAYGYLLKNTDEAELILAIRSVANGKKYFSAEISEKMINFMSAQSISENVLSNKETEVLGLIAKG